MMKIFISYAHADAPTVNRIVQILREANHDVWIDNRLVPGRYWDGQLKTVIESCDCLLYALSPRSWASKWCQWEFATAVHAEKRILPVLIQSPVPFSGVLARVQYVDLCEFTFETGIKFWEGLAGCTKLLPDEVPYVVLPALPKPDDKPLLPEPFKWVAIVQPGKTEINHADEYVPTFDISKYPITNAQYQVFLDSPDGYAQAAWWDFDNAAQSWRASNHQKPSPTVPEDGNLPRVDVSWYEAKAFCCWLSKKLDMKIKLPSEAEWQRAGQGNNKGAILGHKYQVYPWGDSFIWLNCNSGINPQKRPSGPTPVTCFPDGASPFGVMDLIGNAAEWTRTKCDANGQVAEQGLARIVKGGSWVTQTEGELRIESRMVTPPYDHPSTIGFRIVRLFPMV